MDESHYRALLDEVQNDMGAADQAIADAHQAIADAEQSKEELATLEEYLKGKIDGGGKSSGSSRSKSSSKRGSSNSSRKPAPEVAEDDGGKGMQTVEFGPDGFPST